MTKYEYCHVCQRSLDMKEWNKHKYNTIHKQKLIKFLRYQYDSIQKCIIFYHSKEKKRKRNVPNEVEKNQLKELNEYSNQFECRYCKFKLENSNGPHIDQIQNKLVLEVWEHLASYDHKKFLNQFWIDHGVGILVSEVKESKAFKTDGNIPKELSKSSHKLHFDQHNELVKKFGSLLISSKSESIDPTEPKTNSLLLISHNNSIAEFEPTFKLPKYQKTSLELYNNIKSILIPQHFKFTKNLALNPKRVGADWSNRVILFLNSNPQRKEDIETLAKYGTLGSNDENTKDWYPKFGGAWSNSRSEHRTNFWN